MNTYFRHIVRLCLFFTGLFGSTGCIDEYIADSEYQQTGILVVEGIISGDTTLTFYLNRTVSLEEKATSTASPEHGADVRILCNDGTLSVPAIETERGVYTLAGKTLDPQKQYCVQVKTGGETYQSAFTTPIETPSIDSLYWYKENETAPIDILLTTHDPQQKVFHYMWTYEEDWELVPVYNTTHYAIETLSFDDCIREYDEKPNPYYYCWGRVISRDILLEESNRFEENRINGYPIHTFASSNCRLSYLYCITVKQIGLDKEAYRYYKNKQKLMEEMGTIFSPLPSEMKGNMICVSNPDLIVLGYVHVANQITKRMFITREEAFDPSGNDCRLQREQDLIDKIPASAPKVPGTLLDMGYRYTYNLEEGIPFKMWSRVECVDCRAYGTKNKPDFWPNDHK